jgi:hypothetical protein
MSTDSLIFRSKLQDIKPDATPDPIQNQTMLTPRTVNRRKLYDLRIFSLTSHASFSTTRRQDPQPASNSTNVAQGVPEDTQPRVDNKVHTDGGSRKLIPLTSTLRTTPPRKPKARIGRCRSYGQWRVTKRPKRLDALRRGDVSHPGFDQRDGQRWPRCATHTTSRLLSSSPHTTVEKVIIDQESLKRFINKVSPGAYVSLTKIDFRALDIASVKPVGVYGSKERIVYLLLEIGAIEPHLSVIFVSSNVILEHRL